MRIALVKNIFIALVILFCSIAASTQEAPAPAAPEPTRVNAFIGYSFYSTNL